ncbi:hypothetical protein JL722_11981 [Aureococcus anophagefferens]|nr:hypothetical protein JL722_11981 [Aureococcus anophagefferens]
MLAARRLGRDLGARRFFGALPELTECSTLPNGLRVATERTPAECETVTLGVWIDAGSRYEAASNNGSAHFLEHIAFKGTAKRSQRSLEVEVEDMGAHLNAYTSREQTVYYAKLFKEDVGAGMEILGDILQNSLLDAGAVEPARLRRPDADEPRAHVALAFSGASWTSKYAVPLMVLQTLLGQWDRLNPAAGGAGGAPGALARVLAASDDCHSYVTFNTCYKDGGLFGLYLVAPASRRTSSPSSTRSPVREEIGRQFLTYDRRVPLAELLAASAVSPEDLRTTARAFLGGRAHAMAAYGAVDKLRPFDATHVSNF